MREKPILLGPLERVPVIQFPKRRGFLLCFLITRTMDRVRKTNISESYTPSSESYSNYATLVLIVSVVEW
jgi:hypothetical protein